MARHLNFSKCAFAVALQNTHTIYLFVAAVSSYLQVCCSLSSASSGPLSHVFVLPEPACVSICTTNKKSVLIDQACLLNILHAINFVHDSSVVCMYQHVYRRHSTYLVYTYIYVVPTIHTVYGPMKSCYASGIVYIPQMRPGAY